MKQGPHAKALGHRKMIVDGGQEDAASGARLEMVCPSDGQVFSTIPRGDKEDIKEYKGSAPTS